MNEPKTIRLPCAYCGKPNELTERRAFAMTPVRCENPKCGKKNRPAWRIVLEKAEEDGD